MNMKYRSARQFEAEVVDGHNIVHGRPHGFKWIPVYSVEVTFDTEDEANNFYNSLNKKALEGSPTKA